VPFLALCTRYPRSLVLGTLAATATFVALPTPMSPMRMWLPCDAGSGFKAWSRTVPS